jgi:hypothetical protein
MAYGPVGSTWTMTEPNRRALFTTALAAAAVAALGAPALKAATLGDDAELLAMIAEEDRLRSILDELERRGRRLMQEHPLEVRRDLYRLIEDDRPLPEPLESIYTESRRNEEAAEALAFRIDATLPKTMAGVIALIRYGGSCETIVENIVAGLRQIAAREGVA